MEENLTQTELDFKTSPNKVLEVTLDLISALVIISGFIGNILNAIVWYSQRGRSATYIYFIAISISNTFFCVFYFLKYSLDTFGFLQDWLEDDLCEISYDRWRYFLFHPLKEIFLSATIFYSVGLSAERYVSITKPLQFNYLCTRNRTFRVIIILLFLAVAINLPLFFEYVHDKDGGLAELCLKPKKSALRKDPIYIWTYRVCLENLVKFMIPFGLMAFFNAGIIKALKRSRRFRQSMSERRSVTPSVAVRPSVVAAAPEPPRARVLDKPWKAAANHDPDEAKKLTEDHIKDDDLKIGDSRDDGYGDSENHIRCANEDLASNVAQKSFCIEDDGEPGEVRNFDPGSNVAEKSFALETTRDRQEESDVPRIVVHPGCDPLDGETDGREERKGIAVKKSMESEGRSELRSTPSPAGTPVMGKRHSPVRFNASTTRRVDSGVAREERSCFPRVICQCFSIKGEDQKLSFLATCYVTIFLIFILPAVTRRGLFALRSTPEFSILDTDELDYFRWISYLLDAIRPSTDFILYMIVSTKFRASFLSIVTTPCTQVAKLAQRCRDSRAWGPEGGVGDDFATSSSDGGGLKDCLLCGAGKALDPTDSSEAAPFRRNV